MKIFLFLLVLAGCTTSSLIGDDYLVHQATLINQLPVDGCDWHFNMTLDDSTVQYVANPTSQSKVDAIIKSIQTLGTNGLYSAQVNLVYKPTGNKKKIQCGWNRASEMQEIDIVEITKL